MPEKGLFLICGCISLVTTIAIGGCQRVPATPPPAADESSPTPLPWHGKLLILRGDRTLNINAEYRDSNRNGIMDGEDAGWFAPGSTVKVAIALAAIEVNGGRDGIESQLKAALVVSDNRAANQLIERVGGIEALNQILETRGFQHLIVGRFMGEEIGSDPRCSERGRPGNCASASDLIRSLKAVAEGGIFQIGDRDREWLLDVLSATPRELGFDKPDDYCRFLRMPGPQKCGISPFPPQQYSNLSYSPEYDAYIFIVVEPPPGTDDRAIADRMTEIVLDEMPGSDADEPH